MRRLFFLILFYFLLLRATSATTSTLKTIIDTNSFTQAFVIVTKCPSFSISIQFAIVGRRNLLKCVRACFGSFGPTCKGLTRRRMLALYSHCCTIGCGAEVVNVPLESRTVGIDGSSISSILGSSSVALPCCRRKNGSDNEKNSPAPSVSASASSSISATPSVSPSHTPIYMPSSSNTPTPTPSTNCNSICIHIHLLSPCADDR